MRNRFGQTLQAYLTEHQSLYLFIAVLFAVGIIFGAVIVNELVPAQKQELISFLQYFLKQMDLNGLSDPAKQFQQSVGFYLKTVGVMWILGLTIIGLPVIMLLIFLKGVMVGFTVGFLVNQLQWQGVTFSLMGVLPQNMLVVPALLIIGVACISFSLRLMKTRMLSKRDVILPHFLSYSAVVLVMMAVLTLAAMFESYISPTLMQYVIN